MPTIQFIGQYLPSVTDLNLKHFEMTITSGDFAGKRVQIDFGEGNSITVNFEVDEQLSQAAVELAWQNASSIVKGLLDAAAFTLGAAISYSLEFRQDVDGKQVLIMHDERLRAQLSDEFLQRDVGGLLAVLASCPSLRLLLADLNEAVGFPPSRLINCARAIETMRVHIDPDKTGGDGGWLKMREHLGISKSFLQSITDPSKGPRHGDRVPAATGEITDKIMQRTWRVTGRFFQYVLGEEEPLNSDTFPVLTLE